MSPVLPIEDASRRERSPEEWTWSEQRPVRIVRAPAIRPARTPRGERGAAVLAAYRLLTAARDPNPNRRENRSVRTEFVLRTPFARPDFSCRAMPMSCTRLIVVLSLKPYPNP